MFEIYSLLPGRIRMHKLFIFNEKYEWRDGRSPRVRPEGEKQKIENLQIKTITGIRDNE